ncbi:outer membrane channel protein [Massilia eurypsychrophila]|uniref:Outer membrane channel protein n=1 Tax=Massilia eurypsychrophila TaxID=1485217 RepID=A0A2G8TLZ8_9BURK|nr:type II and III secretion system protein family protein [Massilia eurypsychrophila]PIL47014.1 outer membrane channel protein [Massilia eurypsychrophila]
MNLLIKNGQPGRAARLAVFGVLAVAQGLAGAAQPKANPAERADSGPHCVGQAARPASMTLQMGKSTLMRLPEQVRHRSVGNPAVAQAMLVAPDTLYLVGVDVGSTNMIIQGRSGSCSIVDLVVTMDTAPLRAALAAAMPDERNISVSTAGDTIVLSGVVADAPAVARAMELAAAFVRRPLRSLAKNVEGSGAQAAPEAPGAGNVAGVRVVNLLSVSAPQQVMLEVKIAEVSKSLLERLDVGLTWRFSSGSWAATLLSNFLAGNANSVSPANGVLDLRKSNGNRIGADAERKDGLVRMLAEPTVMALSGQEGSFLAGGRIFIPVAQDNNKVTLEEREFGVGLRFTPTVLAGGRINLKVAPEVSEVSREGIGITAGGGLAVLPLITTRRASTTVQLYDGQSFAIGGLIKNNTVTGMNGPPGMSEVPILGALFRSTDYQQDKTEMVFVVTAHLVKPLAPNYALPTDVVTPPTRTQLMLGGRLEGDAPAAIQRQTPAPAVPPQPPMAQGEASAAAARGFELK